MGSLSHFMVILLIHFMDNDNSKPKIIFINEDSQNEAKVDMNDRWAGLKWILSTVVTPQQILNLNAISSIKDENMEYD